MEKKIVKIGMIMILTLALILSSLGVFNMGATPSNEYGAGFELTSENAGGGAFLSLKTAL